MNPGDRVRVKSDCDEGNRTWTLNIGKFVLPAGHEFTIKEVKLMRFSTGVTDAVTFDFIDANNCLFLNTLAIKREVVEVAPNQSKPCTCDRNTVLYHGCKCGGS